MSILYDILSPVISLYFKFQSKRRLPRIEGDFQIHGIKSAVKIIRDKFGIPHIQAKNDQDMIFTQGFTHAQDRLWQMELFKRTANGTLSEIFGEKTLETDRFTRTLGFRRLALKDWENASDEAKQFVESYVSGINAFLNSLETEIPYEFSLLDIEAEEWDQIDCLAISRLVMWQLSHAWYSEIVRTKLIEAVGEEHASKLEIAYHKDNHITLPDGIEFNKWTKDGKLKKIEGPFLSQNMGSNAWVIAGSKTSSGHAILANDMHLTLTIPSIWYNNHLRSKNYNVTGVSIPGLPFIMVGHNENIAWGATLSYIDCTDLFVEKFNTENQYKKGKNWKDPDIIREIIRIKDKLDHQEKIFVTDHGPIISEFIENSTEKLSIQSTVLQPAKSIEGWLLLNKAKNWDDFVLAVKNIESPSLNIIYSDIKDNIGYYCSGKVPLRKNGDGRIPSPGWQSKYDWKGEVPFEEMPHALNPEKGYIITCNNKIVPNDYKYDLGESWMNGYRATRLEQYFKNNAKISISDCKTMQMDYLSIPSLEFIGHFNDLEITTLDPKLKEALDIMKNWNGILDESSIGATLYEVTRFMTVTNLLSKHLGPELTETYIGKGKDAILLPGHEFYGHDTTVLLRMLDNDQSWWLKHAGGKKALLEKSFKDACDWLVDKLGSNISKWKWGAIHKVVFEHALSVREPLDRIFNRGPYDVGGDTDTPCQMAIIPGEEFASKSWGPTWRQIIDMGDLSNSLGMYAPGQSGQLGSKHYDDLISMWLKGEYYTQYWTRGQIENNQEGTLELHPMY